MITIPPVLQGYLSTTGKLKFNAYLGFTFGLERSQQHGDIFVYTNESMMADLMVFWALFSEIDQALKDTSVDVSQFLHDNPSLGEWIRQLVVRPDGCGEYWDSPGALPRSLRRVPDLNVTPEAICKVLRNGFAHFHWRFDNLSGLDYWAQQGWDVLNAQTAFNLPGRAAKNWTAYIVDARPPWISTAFWDMRDLRIVVTPFHILRYHLHGFLNLLLNDSKRDLFGAEVVI